MKMKYENIFGLYNFVGNIFRANLDDNDRAAQRVVKKYQDTGIISKQEEDWVLRELTSETKKITKPYTKVIDEDEFRIYLLEESKLKEGSTVHNHMKSVNMPFVFEDFGNRTILLVSKELFLLKDMYSNEDDKRFALEFYSMLFRSFLSKIFEKAYPYYITLSDFLGLLFYYQVIGFDLTKKEYENIKVRKFGDVETSEMFDLLEDIIRIGEIENLGIPLIPEHPVTQSNIAMEINDRIVWMRLETAYPKYRKEEK